MFEMNIFYQLLVTQIIAKSVITIFIFPKIFLKYFVLYFQQDIIDGVRKI